MRINRKPGNDAPVNFTFWTYNSATPKPQPYGEYALAGGEYGTAERAARAHAAASDGHDGDQDLRTGSGYSVFTLRI